MAHTVLQKDHLILPPKGHIPKKNNTHTTVPTLNSLNMENKTIIVYAKLPNISQMC